MLSGDVNLDGQVDSLDIAAYLAGWAAGDPVIADLDRDGFLSDRDFELLLRAIARAQR
jgi:hypothetical protein